MHQEQKNRSLIAAGFAGTTVLGVVALTVPFVFLPTARKGLPYMATPAHKLQKALQFLQQRGRSHTNNSGPPQQRVFVDLGSGDGEGVYQAVQLLADHHTNKNDTTSAHHYYYQSCIGIELNATLFLLSSIRRRLFWTSEQRARCDFQCRDFWNTSLLSKADTILIFGIAPLMRPLSAKLRVDCRPGKHILSYRFPLPIAEEETEHQSDDKEMLLQADVIYEEADMRIYECRERAVVECERD